MGWRLIRSEPQPLAADPAPADGARAFRDGFLVTVFNPKGLLFFVAFVPQFIRPDLAYLPQAATFVALFTLLGILNGVAYALGADALRRVIADMGVLRWINRASGTAIAGAGLAALFARRPA
ncbi:LysE family translocator [Jannaschia aquimarina]|uniref:Homoserine/homoserine lactone efflux protein n=1 Tax=Jannaschia aquimarina TaxID=935700 RepID=A0A0D1D922_9RHOB|nr:LysE family transporter [Jannaschia aquimarina]KIT16403.1 homoserine/homoserine lactone efflux protein [Jannaschia aquimarina]SNS91413.1 LysE type translocator [Jannaschia aquimarina]